MRLIDADSFIQHLHEPMKYGYSLIDHVKNEPTVPTFGQWISVKDRLPEIEGDYLVRVLDDSISHYTFEVYGWYKGIFIYWTDGMELPVGKNTHGENIPVKVTHWMPLPEPPEE